MEQEDLTHCPFCECDDLRVIRLPYRKRVVRVETKKENSGIAEVTVETHYEDTITGYEWYVMCLKCKAKGPIMETKDECMMGWNGCF